MGEEFLDVSGELLNMCGWGTTRCLLMETY